MAPLVALLYLLVSYDQDTYTVFAEWFDEQTAEDKWTFLFTLKQLDTENAQALHVSLSSRSEY